MFVVKDMGLGLGTTPVVIVMFVVKDMSCFLFIIEVQVELIARSICFYFKIKAF
jgi:hypothetical protein